MLKKFVFALALCAGTVAFGTDWYVDANTTINPDGSQAAPWKLLTDAVANAHDGDVIHLTDGQTHSTVAVTVSAGVTIVGGGDSTLISNSGAITLNHPDAVLTKVKITNTGANSSTALSISKGTLDDCFVYNCRSGNARHTTLSISGGTVQNCRFNLNHPGGYPGTSYSATVQASGPATFRNCLFWGNYAPNSAASMADGPLNIPPGILDAMPASGTATFENCTFADNTGHSAGAVRVKSVAGNVVFRGCVIAGNHTYFDLASRYGNASEDICLNKGKGTVTFEHCLVGKMPSASASGIEFVDCWTDVAAGYKDETTADYTIVKGSPAYGYGYGAATLPTDFDCAIETPPVDRAVGSLTVVLKAKLFNAPEGTATYDWDLDGDGIYETPDGGASVEHTFDTLGWNRVGLKVTVGGSEATYACDNFVRVAPKTIYVRQKTKTSTFVPTYPYATEDTAADSIKAAYDAAIDGCVIKILGTSSLATGNNFSFVKKIELVGDDADPAKTKLTGEARSEQTFVGDGAFIHGVMFSSGWHVLNLNGNSIVSNCVVTGGNMSTASSGTGLCVTDGLFTHGRIYGNVGSNGSAWGLYILGGTVRNTYIYNNKTSAGTAAGYNNAAVTVAGGTVENCTIAKNCAPTTATNGKIGGVEITGKAIFRNNVVWGNTCPHPLTESANNWWIKDGVDTTGIYNNVTETDGLGSPCYTDNPQFAAIDTYDFSITSASGCYNKGANQDWMTDDATDIAGNVRVQGGTVDVGAYEADASVVTLGIASELLEGGVGSAEYSLSVTGEYGSLPSGTRYAWDFDGDGTWDDYGLVVTHTFGEGKPTITMQAMDASGNPVAEPAVSAEAVDVKAVTVYVNANSANPAYPYNTEEKAAATIVAGFAAAGEGSEVVVFPGTYSGELGAVSKRLTIRSTGGASVTTLSASPFCTLAHDEALLEGFRLAPPPNTRGTGIILQSGTIRKCLVDSFYHTTPGRLGIDASGGLIDRCEIRNCYNNSDTDAEGNYVYLGGTAVMRDSLLWRPANSSKVVGGSAVYVGANARMENCVVYNVKSLGPAVKNLGTVVNCILLNNVMSGASDSIGAPNWTVAGEGKFENCISTVLGDPSAVPGILVGDPDFTAPADGDFTISSASIAFNAGKNLDWMAEAEDFYGNDRISGTTAEERGGIVDIGIHEVNIFAPDLNIGVTPVTGLGATEVTFTAVPNAFELSPDATFKWYLKDEVEEGDVPDSTANPFVTTLEPGSYSVSLFVSNADGQGKDFHRVKREVVTITPTDIYIEAGEDFAAKVSPAADGTTVHLGEGVHVVSNQFVTTKAVSFVGAGRGKTFLVNAADKTNAVLSIGNAASSVRDLTICDAGAPMLTVAAGGGTVENVALTDVRDSSTTLGGALRMMGGTLRLSYIQNNACAKSKAPIYLGGETVVLEDCLIAGNSSTGTGADAVGAIRLARGIVRNCTITGNRSAANAGGVVMTGEHETSGYYTVGLINTIVWGNVCDVGSLYDNVYFPPVTDENHFNAPNQFCKNNYTYPVITGGRANIGSADDPGFVNAAKGDYRLQYGAPARNKGLYEDWMATAVDLKGNPRSKNPVKGKVDIGCYETGRDGLMLMVR